MQCTPKCEQQIKAPWGDISQRQLQSSSAMSHPMTPQPISTLPPLNPVTSPSVLNDSTRQLALNDRQLQPSSALSHLLSSASTQPISPTPLFTLPPSSVLNDSKSQLTFNDRQLQPSSALSHLLAPEPISPLPLMTPVTPPTVLNDSTGQFTFNGMDVTDPEPMTPAPPTIKSPFQSQERSPSADISLQQMISWGNPVSTPVFLNHGRQDSAMTFQPLVQLMNTDEFYYVAINMPGSGNSAPFPNESLVSATTDCLKIEVPEEPFNPEDREVTLILAGNRRNPDSNQSTFDVRDSRKIDVPRPTITPAFYTLNQDKDFVVIQMEEEEDSEAQSHRITDSNINVEADYNANLPANIQPNAEQIVHSPNSNEKCDDGDTDWTDIDDDENELEDWTHDLQLLSNDESQNKMINIDFSDSASEVGLDEDFKHFRNEILALTSQNVVDAASLIHDIKNLTIHGKIQIKCQPSRRKRGMKLKKIPETIICNDHGGRRCPFATKSAHQMPSETGFFFVVGKRTLSVPSRLLQKMARGWAWKAELAIKENDEDPSQNAADNIPQNSATSPIFEQDSKLSETCVLADCPHMPPGLIAWIHAFFKDNKMQQQRNGVGNDSLANNVQLSPISTKNQQPIVLPPIYQIIPQDCSYAPSAPPYSPESFAANPYMSYPTVSSTPRDFSLPGIYSPISPAFTYNYDYMCADSSQPANPPQYKLSDLSPRTYSVQPPQSPSYDVSEPWPVQPNGVSCCCRDNLLNSQKHVPSNPLKRQDMQNNEEICETVKGVKITRFHFVAAMEAAIEHLRWDKFIFVGHSLGAEVGLFYNSVNPGKITKMILLDPEMTFRRLQIRDLSVYQKRFYDNYYENYWKENFDYKTYTIPEAKQALMRARNLTEDQASIILSDSLKHVKGDQYRLTWDRRLKTPAPQNYPNAYYFALFSNIPPTLIISASFTLGEQSQSGSLELLNMLCSLKNCNHITVEGSHDVHLTNPEIVAPHVIEFLSKENKVSCKL